MYMEAEAISNARIYAVGGFEGIICECACWFGEWLSWKVGSVVERGATWTPHQPSSSSPPPAANRL